VARGGLGIGRRRVLGDDRRRRRDRPKPPRKRLRTLDSVSDGAEVETRSTVSREAGMNNTGRMNTTSIGGVSAIAEVTVVVSLRPGMPNDIALIGLDSAKSVFQLRGAAADGRAVLRRRLRLDEVVRPTHRNPPRHRTREESCCSNSD
jgi:hypothetical protein